MGIRCTCVGIATNEAAPTILGAGGGGAAIAERVDDAFEDSDKLFMPPTQPSFFDADADADDADVVDAFFGGVCDGTTPPVLCANSLFEVAL